MNIIGGIELPVYHWKKEAIKNEQMGLSTKESDVYIQDVTFYQIDNVSPYNSFGEDDDDDDNCYVISGGFQYCVAENHQYVNSKIRECQTFLIN